jgi:ABC-type nitrate/sulfonate/bicarbonate transport system permease component
MTAIDPQALADEEREARRARLFTRINKADGWFQVLGLSFITPVLKAIAGDNPRAQMKEIWRLLGVPVLAICVFLIAWGTLAPKVQTSLGAVAWLPIVTMVVSATYTVEDGLFSKAFLTSAITVTLCSLWPTLINTALGVASIDKDLVSVSKVLKMNTYTKVTKLVLPSALPLIFTGLRLSLGVGWMVLIAAEMLAQNPGLGKFVWDEFQNGSSSSLAKIMVAVFTIGIIGFLLDRLMYAIQSLFTFSNNR